MDTPLDLGEEATGDAGFGAGWSMEGDGNAVGDRLLVACQVGNDCVKRQAAKVLPELGKAAALIRPGPFEAGNKVAEQDQVWVVEGADVVHGGGDLDDALRTSIGGFQGNHDEVRRAQCRKAHQGESGRAVEDDVVVAVSNFTEPLCKRQMEVRTLPQLLVGKVMVAAGAGAGLNEAEALAEMIEWSRECAEPEWTVRELLHKVRDAYGKTLEKSADAR